MIIYDSCGIALIVVMGNLDMIVAIMCQLEKKILHVGKELGNALMGGNRVIMLVKDAHLPSL